MDTLYKTHFTLCPYVRNIATNPRELLGTLIKSDIECSNTDDVIIHILLSSLPLMLDYAEVKLPINYR